MWLIKNGAVTAITEDLPNLTDWHAAGQPDGVALTNTDRVEDIAAALPNLAVVALHFPKFNDGRAYSQARILRGRYGFAGEIRATGTYGRDQLLFLHRSGFDGFAVAERDQADKLLADLTAARAEISHFYQPASDHVAPIAALRRHAAGGIL